LRNDDRLSASEEVKTNIKEKTGILHLFVLNIEKTELLNKYVGKGK